MDIKKMLMISAAALSAAATSAQAEQGFYLGGGVGYGQASSDVGSGSPASDNNAFALGLTAGYRIEHGNMFFGPELNVDWLPDNDLEGENSGNTCSQGASGPYFCNVDEIYRLRAIIGGAAGGDYEWFGAVGYGIAVGDGANSPFSTDSASAGGVTLGAGVQRNIGPKGKLRVEVIHDMFTNTIDRSEGGLNPPPGGEPEYEQTSVKASYLFQF